jgi:hypothetical protein
MLFASPVRATGEYELKAAFLYNFAVFTEWPNLTNTLKLCVIGDDPFGNAMQPLAQKTVHGAAIKVQRISHVDEARSCQILFIAASEHGNVPLIASQLRDNPVLTVAESNGFDHRNVAITMVTANNRVGFEINQSLAQQVRLKLSAHLLKLARQVQ